MSNCVVKCSSGTVMQWVCAHYYCAAVMVNPRMLHFTSLTQGTYTSLLLDAINTGDEPEHSSMKLNQ